MKLFVANIPYESTEDDIQDLFSNHGDVVDFYMPRDRDSGNYKGFAFVTYSSESEARDAIEAINGQEFNGRNLHVDEAKEKKPSGGGGGGGKFRNNRNDRGGRGGRRDRY